MTSKKIVMAIMVSLPVGAAFGWVARDLWMADNLHSDHRVVDCVVGMQTDAPVDYKIDHCEREVAEIDRRRSIHPDNRVVFCVDNYADQSQVLATKIEVCEATVERMERMAEERREQLFNGEAN